MSNENNEESPFIDITCFENDDTKLVSPTQITLPIKDLKTNLYKENDSHFIKYFHYQYNFYKDQLYNKTECTMRIKPEEYKRLKKMI